MSFVEMKQKVPTLSREERLELAHLLLHLKLQEEPEYHAEMARRMSEMDSGQKFSLEDLESRLGERDSRAK